MNRTRLLTLVVSLSLTALPAQAQLATFDDLASCVPTNGSGVLVPNGYAGFLWSNFYVADGPQAAITNGGAGYANGVVTPRCFAANGFGAMSTISSATDFTFNGGFFSAAFNDGLSLRIAGFNGTSELFFTTLMLNTSGPQLVDVNWTGLTSVTFSSGDGSSGSQFVYDNFRFNNALDPVLTPVPEPATMTLLATGLAGVFGAARRRKQGARLA